ncbi:MAG: HD domain-containing protein [Spirochaetia bacterium]|nr:HD domain-containing protein [Spirochaetia bacterium]
MAAPESVIEIGSTGVRLLVAEYTADCQQNILDRSEKPLPIGRDVFNSGAVSQETQNQLIQILKRYREQLAGWGLTPAQCTCFATSSFRNAKNSDPVMDRILVQTGFRVKIFDGIEENRLMYLAVTDCLKGSPVDYRKDDTVILTVGGSNTEIMLISNGKMAAVHSIKLGTIRIEQHMKSQASSFDDIQRFIQESINNTRGSLESELSLNRVKQFLAVGTDLTRIAILIGRPISTFLWEIEKEDFEEFVKEIQYYSIDEIVARFKISYSEAETMQVSLLIYHLFLIFTKADKVLVPETNIRNGYLLSKTNQNDELQKEFNTQVVASAKNLLRKFHGDIEHAHCVMEISDKIYETLKEELALDDYAKLLLKVAAILHDIGVFINHDSHNIHSSYIITNSEIFGLSKNDRLIVAEIAKYHKGKAMPQDDEAFLRLQRSDRMTILKLTSILRIADSLDRGHIQNYSDVTIEVNQNNMIIHTKDSTNTVLEKIALSEKAGMFEEVFGYKVILL